MTMFADSLRFLFSLGPELKTIKWELARIELLLGAIGSPQSATRFIHDGGGDTDAVASSRGVAEKRLFIDYADSSAGGEGDKDQSNGSLGVHGEIR